MKRGVHTGLAALLALALALSLSGCRIEVKLGYGVTDRVEKVEKTKLDTPTALAMDNDCILTFTGVFGADEYRLTVNGHTQRTRFTTVGLATTEGFSLPADGEFDVAVTALPKYPQENLESDPATAHFSVRGPALPTPEVTLAAPNVLAVSYDEGSRDVRLVVNEFEFGLDDLAGGTLDLSSFRANEFSVTLQALGDNVYRQDSLVAGYAYTRGSSYLRLPKVENVRMDGLTLRFDPIGNAYSYAVTDVLNNVYEVRQPYVDFTARTMPVSVRALPLSTTLRPGDPQDEIVYFTRGEGTVSSPFEISTWEQFRYIEYYERQDLARVYKMTADVTFPAITIEDVEEGSNFREIGSLSGTFDGGGHTIGGIITNSSRGFVGMFETIGAQAVFQNVTFSNCDLRTWRVQGGDNNIHPMGGSIGIVCRDNYGSIENITVENCSLEAVDDAVSLTAVNYGSITDVRVGENEIASGAEGGLIATVNKGTIKACTVEQNVYEARLNPAGVSALNYGLIEGCVNNAILFFGTRDEVGGIVSWNEGTIKECKNTAEIAAKNYAGGMAGKNGGVIENCVNEGTIWAVSAYAGGIAGATERLKSSIVEGYQSRIAGCKNAGVVQGGDNAGGIVGGNANGRVELSVNLGSVTSSGSAGGIVGYAGVKGKDGVAWVNASVYVCYNSGAVNGKGGGGIAGRNATWRYDTSWSSPVKQSGMGIYGCVSVRAGLVSVNDNQVSDSYSDRGLLGGSFFVGSVSTPITGAIVALKTINTQAFADKMNALAKAESLGQPWKLVSGVLTLDIGK